MKKALLLLLFSGTILCIETKSFSESVFSLEAEESSSPRPESSSYILQFRFSPQVKAPAICGFYKGYRLDFSSGLCIIKEAHTCSSFSIIIAEDVTINVDQHAIHRLEQIPSKKCRMFYLTKKIKKDSIIEWDVEEERDNIPLVLPKAAIIILFNPDCIDKITPCLGKKTTQEDVFSLPFIEVKKTISQKDLDDTCKASWCASVGMRGIHRSTNITKKNDVLRLISLARPLSTKLQ